MANQNVIRNYNLTMKRLKVLLSACVLGSAILCAYAGNGTEGTPVVINLTKEYGVKPGVKGDCAPKFARALDKIKSKYNGRPVTMVLEPGVYNLYPKGCVKKTYYISNHDQPNPKAVGIAIEDWDNVTLIGEGAELLCHGRMLPVAVVRSNHCRIEGVSIDFDNPQICQVEVIENTENGITFRTAPWVNASVENGKFVARGEGWKIQPNMGIAFDPATRRLVYRTSDVRCPLDSVIALPEKGVYRAPKWKHERLLPGTIMALRNWERPAPAIFLGEDVHPEVKNVTVHYVEGMGVLAQVCDSVSLDGFSVRLRGDDDPRYFTTQADATHFSGCKGLISSTNGLYEGMMDDAINVHGTYLKAFEKIDARTLKGRYMHSQSYGFKWGEPGDSVQFIRSFTMEVFPEICVIESITPIDKETVSGAKEFEIRFTSVIPTGIDIEEGCGMENLTWSPEVYFADNVIKNNRARGSLFSTPRHTVVERNLFDHTSGSAILLCGDCRGWYETGACHDVIIRDNKFINALTNLFQFTEAVISIYPEIKDLWGQKEYFHSGIVIENNEFETFDAPLLYAKSTDGLVFRGNKVRFNHDYPPFHKNNFNFRLQRCRNVTINGNSIDSPSVKIE